MSYISFPALHGSGCHVLVLAELVLGARDALAPLLMVSSNYLARASASFNLQASGVYARCMAVAGCKFLSHMLVSADNHVALLQWPAAQFAASSADAIDVCP